VMMVSMVITACWHRHDHDNRYHHRQSQYYPHHHRRQGHPRQRGPTAAFSPRASPAARLPNGSGCTRTRPGRAEILLYVCMYVYIHIHTYRCTYMCIYLYTYMCIYVYTYILYFALVQACSRLRLCVWLSAPKTGGGFAHVLTSSARAASRGQQGSPHPESRPLVGGWASSPARPSAC